MSFTLNYGITKQKPCNKANRDRHVIESVVYCAAGLILLTLGVPGPNFNTPNYHDFRRGPGKSVGLYVSLIFLVIPSLMLLITFEAKIFSCLCCICGNKFIQSVKKVLNRTPSDRDTLLPQELPDGFEHPLDYELLKVASIMAL